VKLEVVSLVLGVSLVLLVIQNLRLRISSGYDKLTDTSWVSLICRYIAD